MKPQQKPVKVSSPSSPSPADGKEADGSVPSARFSKKCLISTDPSLAKYPDGSYVVQVKDLELNCIVYMRRFPNGEMIPI